MLNRGLRRIRALEIIRKRTLLNASREEIAANLNVSRDTVQRELLWATREGVMQTFEDRILSELIPLAMDRAVTELKSGKAGADVAMKILAGTNLLKKPSEHAPPKRDIDQMDQWLQRRAAMRVPHGALPEPTLEVDYTEFDEAPDATEPARADAGAASDRRDLRGPLEAVQAGPVADRRAQDHGPAAHQERPALALPPDGPAWDRDDDGA